MGESELMPSGNIVLTGMPGAGKSTVGVVLAKTLGLNFIDTDLVLSRRLGATLQAYIDACGIPAFLREEEKAALSLRRRDCVIATGGSMVLSEAAMRHLKRGALTVFLDIPPEKLKKRLKNIKTRGVVLKPGQTVEDLYGERLPLYLKFADFTVPREKEKNPGLEALVAEIAALYRARREEKPL